MKVNAKLKNLRISPRKVREVADIVKGYDINDALIQLDNIIKRTSHPLFKLLNSAIANAENNFGLDRDNLYVFDIKVGEGPILKRWMPRAYGRASQILKRTSHVEIILEERVEGKNRKSKTQLEKERKAREDEKKKMEKELTEGKEETSEEVKKEDAGKTVAEHGKEHHEVEGKRKQSRQSGWTNKIFRRKSS